MSVSIRMLAVALLAASACVSGAPLGFSSGTNWNIPLVGSLEDGQLVAPVSINGHGPYLFFINPHSASIIDPRIARTADMYTERSDLRLTGASDTVTHEEVWTAEALEVAIGDLTVSKRTFLMLPGNATYHGQPIVGTIGREFLAESLIWVIDRDREMLFLATQDHQPPTDAAMLFKADRIEDGRFFIEPRINGRATYLFMDLGQPVSAVWPAIAEKTELEPMAGETLTDYFGRRISYQNGYRARSVELGDASVRDIVLMPWNDKRIRPRDMDGFLGRNFFGQFRITVNWHKKSVWLEPRARDINEYLHDRLARWGDRLRTCDKPGCVEATIATDDAGVTNVRIDRDADAAGVTYEVLLEAVDDTGKPLPLPRLLAAFPAGATVAVLHKGDAQRYTGASGLRVIDVTPFAPECDTSAANQGCMFTIR